MKAGTMRPIKKVLGIALLGTSILAFLKPETILSAIVVVIALPSAYFLIFTGRQGG